MNYFYLSKYLYKSANYLDNSRISKMIVETGQILSTVIRKKLFTMYKDTFRCLYKKTHENHPVVKWTGNSLNNFMELYTYGLCLCSVYEKRFNKKHKTINVFLAIQPIIMKYGGIFITSGRKIYER